MEIIEEYVDKMSDGAVALLCNIIDGFGSGQHPCADSPRISEGAPNTVVGFTKTYVISVLDKVPVEKLSDSGKEVFAEISALIN